MNILYISGKIFKIRDYGGLKAIFLNVGGSKKMKLFTHLDLSSQFGNIIYLKGSLKNHNFPYINEVISIDDKYSDIEYWRYGIKGVNEERMININEYGKSIDTE